jgi:hypothetical protein
MEMAAMARTWKQAKGSKGLIVTLPLPGPMGKFLRAGRNLAPGEPYGRMTFGAWLANRPENL